MLVTEVTLKLKAGSGGNGKVAFYPNKRGPSGGNGGPGGNVIIKAGGDIYSLKRLANLHQIKAENGQAGRANKAQGTSGADLILELPVGTEVTDTNTGEIFEINNESAEYIFCQGGKGGWGNAHFKSNYIKAPDFAEQGDPGQERSVLIDLKLLADYGLIGFPNAGKSSLLAMLTKATPKIANYPFTTLSPNLGELNKKIIADIPGLIEGASKGKGLGFAFLKHIEKVSLLLHCISVEEQDPVKAYKTLRAELGTYKSKLLELPEIILLTKTDLAGNDTINKKQGELNKLNKKVITISVYDQISLQNLRKLLSR